MLFEKVKRQDLDIYDYNWMLLFDKDDKEYVNDSFTNDLKQYSILINKGNYKRAKLRREIKLLHMSYQQNRNMNHAIEISIKMAIAKEELLSMDRILYNYRKEQIDLIKEFHKLAHLRQQDKTLPRNHVKFEPIQSVYKEDVYVSQGVDIIGAQITNQTSVIWEYVDIGTAQRPATVGDQELDNSIGRFPIDEGGSFTSIGDQIRLFCVLPDQIPDNDIYEFSINELPEGGKTLSRTTFTKPIKHKFAKTFPTITNVTYVIPHLESE